MGSYRPKESVQMKFALLFLIFMCILIIGAFIVLIITGRRMMESYIKELNDHGVNDLEPSDFFDKD